MTCFVLFPRGRVNQVWHLKQGIYSSAEHVAPERGCNKNQRAAKPWIHLSPRGTGKGGGFLTILFFHLFFCKNILKWNIKTCRSAFRSKPKEFHMAVLLTEYVIHVGWVLSLSPVSPGREEAPVVTASLIVPFLPVVKGQILNANWHSLQACIIYEARVRNWKDSYNQYEHKQNILLAISATQRGCPSLVITLNIFFTFLNCNSQCLAVCLVGFF